LNEKTSSDFKPGIIDIHLLEKEHPIYQAFFRRYTALSPPNIQFPPIVRETHAGQVDFGMAINQLKQVFLAITNFMAQNDETYKMVNHNKYVVEMSLAFLVYHP